jgi:hypothetical protein
MTDGQLKKVMGNEWNTSRDKKNRVTIRSADRGIHNHAVKRISSLGNSLVPQCAAFAFQTLVTVLKSADTNTVSMSVPLKRASLKTTVRLHTPTSTEGLDVVRPTVSHHLPDHPWYEESHLEFVDDDGHVHRSKLWRTPTHSKTSLGQCRKMTPRSLWNLGNLIYYEKNTSCPLSPKISERSKFYMIDPNYIEYMMGYPKDWTKFMRC